MLNTNELSLTDNSSGIYGLRSRTTGKWYIGQSVNVRTRMYDYSTGYKCKKQRKLYNAMRKYGCEDFDKFLIERCPTVKLILDERECFWIQHYNSILNGYNILPGGDGCSEEARLVFSKINSGSNNPRYGTKHSEETKAKMRLAHTGKKHSEETKRKMSVTHKLIGC